MAPKSNKSDKAAAAALKAEAALMEKAAKKAASVSSDSESGSGSEKEESKKKAVRKAPAEKAGQFEVGHTMTGQDGNEYVIKADAKGTKRWFKAPAEAPAKPASYKTTPAAKKEKAAAPKKEKAAPKKEKKTKAKEAESESEAEPEQPKLRRAPTAYNKFMKMRVAELKEEEAEGDHKERFKSAANEWKAMSKEEKEAATVRAEAFVEAHPEPPRLARKKRAKKSEDAAPKRTRAPTAFNLFMGMRVRQMKEDEAGEGLTHKERFTAAAAEWSAMSKEEKAEAAETAKAYTAERNSNTDDN